MRFLSLVISLTIFGLLVGQSPAQKNDDAEKSKRIAQIEKELAELQDRIAALTAELAKLRAVEQKPLRGSKPVVVKGTITKMDPAGFWLKHNEINPPVLFVLLKDSEIIYSDKQKAKPSDLKVAQRVSVHSCLVELGLKKEPQSGNAYKVIIEKQEAPDEVFDKLPRGVVAKVGDPFKEGLKVQCAAGGVCYPMLLYFDKDTKIIFANRKNATLADLKPGRWISFQSSAKLEPMGIKRARVDLVVLDLPDDGKFPHHALAVSRDRKWIATVGWTLGVTPPVIRVVLVDAQTSKVVRELECDTSPVNKLVFAPDGKLLYGGVDLFNFGDHYFHGNGRLSVWDVDTGKSVKEMTAGVWALSADGKHLAIVNNFVDIDPGIEGRKALPPKVSVQVFDTTTWKEVARLREENAGMAALCFSPDGKTLALSVRPYDIRLWDWQAGKYRLRIEATKWKEATEKMWGAGWVPYLEFSPDGALLASMTDVLPDYYETPRKIDLWDASTGKLVRSLEVGQYRPLYLTFTPKGDRIAMYDQAKIRLVDAVSGKTTKEFKCQAGNWIGLAPAMYRQGLTPEQAPKAAPVFQQLWKLTGGAD